MVGFTHNDNARQPVDAGYNVSSAATVDNSAKILVCDDDMMVRLLARECLEEAGMSVVDAADGDEAIAMFALEQPDLVFLDVDMPGKTWVRSVPRNTRHCPWQKCACPHRHRRRRQRVN